MLEHRPQICFLDIRLPATTGLEAARAITEDWPDDAGTRPLFAFVTAYDPEAPRAFEAAAVDDLLKPVTPVTPVTPERLARSVARLRARLAQPAPAKDATLSAPRHPQAAVGDAIELVPLERTVCLEAADNFVRAGTAERDCWGRVSLRAPRPQLDLDASGGRTARPQSAATRWCARIARRTARCCWRCASVPRS